MLSLLRDLLCLGLNVIRLISTFNRIHGRMSGTTGAGAGLSLLVARDRLLMAVSYEFGAGKARGL